MRETSNATPDPPMDINSALGKVNRHSRTSNCHFRASSLPPVSARFPFMVSGLCNPCDDRLDAHISKIT